MTFSKQLIKRILEVALCLSSIHCIGALARPEEVIVPPGNSVRNTEQIRKKEDKAATDPHKGYIISYLIWRSSSYELFQVSQVILDVVDGKNIILKQRTLVNDAFTGYRKTWDHDIVSSKACPKQKDKSFSVVESQCIIGRKNIIQLPPGARPFDYVYTVEWIEENEIRTAGPAPLKKYIKILYKKPLD